MLSKTKLKKIISYIIPPIITVGLCYVLYSGVDLGEIWSGAKLCNPWLMAAFMACNVLAMVVRGYRWRLQLRAINVNPGTAQMSRAIFGTYAVNLVFPRLGEFWRCTYVARLSAKPFSGVFGTMVADRLSDTLIVGLLCGATFLLSHAALRRFLDSASIPADVFTSPAAIALYALPILLALYLIFGKGKIAQKVRDFLLRTWRGFTVIFHMPRRGQWLLYTALIWGSYVASMWLSMLAYPPTAALAATHGAQCVMVTFVFGSLAMAIPSNGGIGPWQFAIILSLSKLYGLDAAQALTFATINLGATTLLTILLGIYTFLHIVLKKS
ncbi:MAG: flippase-like domain-containing protein [Bacteroides sp.]|nr:flippase-like domain-containing protein [Bacteroides sp.]